MLTQSDPLSVDVHPQNGHYLDECFDDVHEAEADVVEAFRTFDADGDGLLTPADCRRLLARVGVSLSDSELTAFISRADVDEDGMINYQGL